MADQEAWWTSRPPCYDDNVAAHATVRGGNPVEEILSVSDTWSDWDPRDQNSSLAMDRTCRAIAANAGEDQTCLATDLGQGQRQTEDRNFLVGC